MDRCISCLLKCTPNECLVILRIRRKRWRMKEKLKKLVAEIHAQIKRRRIKAGDNWEGLEVVYIMFYPQDLRPF